MAVCEFEVSMVDEGVHLVWFSVCLPYACGCKFLASAPPTCVFVFLPLARLLLRVAPILLHLWSDTDAQKSRARRDNDLVRSSQDYRRRRDRAQRSCKQIWSIFCRRSHWTSHHQTVVRRGWPPRRSSSPKNIEVSARRESSYRDYRRGEGSVGYGIGSRHRVCPSQMTPGQGHTYVVRVVRVSGIGGFLFSRGRRSSKMSKMALFLRIRKVLVGSPMGANVTGPLFAPKD